MVLVIAVEELFFDVLIERSIEVFAPFNGNLQIVKILVTLRFVLDVDAAHIIRELATKKVSHRPLNRRSLHLLLQFVNKYSVEFLHVVLHERVIRVPTETLGQLLGAYTRIAVLQLIEDALQCERNRRLGVLAVGRMHVVHCL